MIVSEGTFWKWAGVSESGKRSEEAMVLALIMNERP